MEVKLKNDCKKTPKSIQAEIELNNKTDDWGYFNLKIIGYGGNVTHAKINLKYQIDDLITELQNFKNSL